MVEERKGTVFEQCQSGVGIRLAQVPKKEAS